MGFLGRDENQKITDLARAEMVKWLEEDAEGPVDA